MSAGPVSSATVHRESVTSCISLSTIGRRPRRLLIPAGIAACTRPWEDVPVSHMRNCGLPMPATALPGAGLARR